MTSNQRILSVALTAILAVLVIPASAPAEYLVPEGNSAVKQYTEGFPTAGGEKKTEGNRKPVTVAKAIGAGNAKKLEDHSADGAAAAEVAAETAPAGATPTASSEEAGTGNEGQPGQHGNAGHERPPKAKPAKDGSDSKQDQSGGAAANGDDGPSGSSGLGEVLAAATGSSSGSLGLLLPLTILAAVAWAIAFLWRQRQRPDLAAGDKP
jgi:hypothetical protein